MSFLYQAIDPFYSENLDFVHTFWVNIFSLASSCIAGFQGEKLWRKYSSLTPQFCKHTEVIQGKKKKRGTFTWFSLLNFKSTTNLEFLVKKKTKNLLHIDTDLFQQKTQCQIISRLLNIKQKETENIQGTLTYIQKNRSSNLNLLAQKSLKLYQNLFSMHEDAVNLPMVLTRLHRDPLFWADQISDCCIVWHCLPLCFWTVEYLFHTCKREISNVK